MYYMQHLLPIGLAKSVNLVTLSVTKLFRTLLLASGLLVVFTMQAKAQSGDWSSLTTIDGVEISYQHVFCDNGEILLIRLENSAEQAVSFNLQYKITSNDDASIVGSGELGIVSIEANSVISSTCGDNIVINSSDHISFFNKDEFTLSITKTE